MAGEEKMKVRGKNGERKAKGETERRKGWKREREEEIGKASPQIVNGDFDISCFWILAALLILMSTKDKSNLACRLK